MIGKIEGKKGVIMSRIRENRLRGVLLAILVLLFFVLSTTFAQAEETSNEAQDDALMEDVLVVETQDEAPEVVLTEDISTEDILPEDLQEVEPVVEPVEITIERQAESDEIIFDQKMPGDNEITDSMVVELTSSYEATASNESTGVSVARLFGDNRYETSIEIADELKKELGISTFNNIVIATGESYPDALSGAYLARTKSAPILLVSENSANMVANYIRQNLSQNSGTVYILGGEQAVSKRIESAVSAYADVVRRINGNNRFETNLEILREVDANGIGEMAVVSGSSYADALSASALDMPLMLAGKYMTESQAGYLDYGRMWKDIYIIGGTSAVSESFESSLNYFGDVERIAGENRYETSAKVAERFFSESDEAIVTSGANFPDGVSGGPLAQAKRVPLLLISNDVNQYVINYLHKAGVTLAIGLGGEKAFSSNALKAEPTVIVKKPSRVTDGDIHQGIDVSVFNGIIDWELVAEDGIEFAFVRVGGRFGATGFIYDDHLARQNMAGAITEGLSVGAYFFTQAVTTAEAVQEAKYLLDTIDGFNMALPLVIDTEYLGGGRHDAITTEERTSIVRAFCDTIREAGFEPMIYSNTSWLENQLNMDELSDIQVWVAEWSDYLSYEGDYVCWQYSETGYVDGINGDVDMNYWYGSLPQ